MTTKTLCDCCGDACEPTEGWIIRLSTYDREISMHKHHVYADLCSECGPKMEETLEKYLVKLRVKK
jgi:hypothetical protein